MSMSMIATSAEQNGLIMPSMTVGEGVPSFCCRCQAQKRTYTDVVGHLLLTRCWGCSFELKRIIAPKSLRDKIVVGAPPAAFAHSAGSNLVGLPDNALPLEWL